MDLNEYLAECLVKERLAEARAAAARSALLRDLPPRLPGRVAVGLALIRIGRWILGQAPENVSEPNRLVQSGEPSRG